MLFKKTKIISLLLIISIIYGCSASHFSRTAYRSYDIGEYHAATEKLLKAYRKEKDREKKKEYDYLLATAYSYIGDYRKAEIRYRNLMRNNYPDSSLVLKYANVLRFNEKYNEAAELYRQILDSIPEHNEALIGLKSCEVTPEWEEKPTRHIVTRERLLNTRDAEYSPVFVSGLDNKLIFTSTREGSKGRGKSAITGMRNGDLWKSNYDIQRQRWEKPELLDEEQLINTSLDEGAATLSSDGGTMLFTRCRFDKTKALGAEIFESQSSRDSWSEATEVEIFGDSIIVAHPSLSADGQKLYFVSDQDGGFGGKDIWVVEKISDGWSEPENLGPKINTEGNEMFPFIRDDGTLYFSSDYHVGMGGLDIFQAYLKETGGEKQLVVENMKAPINSTGDDFSIFFLPGKDQGMFASNRKGSQADDLYSFILPPKIFRIEGEIVNSETETRVNDAYLRVIGTDGTMLKVRSDDGKFQYRMNPETEYIFAAFKEGFLNAKRIISTLELEDSKNFELTLQLTPTDVPVNVDNINYEFGKWDLLPGSIQALDSLVEILEMNPTIVVEIMSHTDFIGSVQFNSELSQKRAQGVVDYLIQKGIHPSRLVAKGYGETWPKKVNRKIAKQYEFLKPGDVLSEDFINKLETEEQQEIAKSIDRRTEFRVLSTDFRE
ncbi:MAG: PD40 domain-containing protein [Prolixibacteraceae bacterium]|nr:PD40 domain-containing protein [Prolixibacteraceae bacterium]